MTPAQIALVQQSFWRVAPSAQRHAAMFYERLFTIDPTTRRLFGTTDMEEQGRKLMETLGVVLVGLTQPETVLSAARDMARRHVGYGVQAAHYASVGAALIWTFRETMGAAFTAEEEAAWEVAYSLISGVMVEAAAEA